MSNPNNRARMGANVAKKAVAAKPDTSAKDAVKEVAKDDTVKNDAVKVDAINTAAVNTDTAAASNEADSGTDTDGADAVATSAIEGEPAVLETIESLFTEVLKLAEATPSDVLHAKNLINNIDGLFSTKKGLLTSTDYQIAGKRLLSTIRSLNIVTDKVFIAAIPVILDLFDSLRGEGDRMFTDEILPFNIFGNSVELRGLNEGHPQFITAIGALADKATRTKVGKAIDIEHNFSVLVDDKRTLIKSLFR